MQKPSPAASRRSHRTARLGAVIGLSCLGITSVVATSAPAWAWTTSPSAPAIRDVTVQNATFAPGVANRFTGTATPGATLHVGFLTGWQSHPEAITVQADGTWSFDHTPPAGADNLLMQFRQEVGGVDRVSRIFELTAGEGNPAPEDPSAVMLDNTTFIPGVKNRFSGTAAPGARLQVRFPTAWQYYPHDIVVQADGTWSFDHTPPAHLDRLDMWFEQDVDGTTRRSEVFTLERGPGTPAPEDPAELAAPTVSTTTLEAGERGHIEGTATAGAHITALDADGRALAVREFQADDDGAWSFDYDIPTTSDTFSFRLEQSLGDLHSVSEVLTVQVEGATPPAERPEFRDVTVDNTSFIPGARNRFTGTATPGATLRVGFASGWQSHVYDIPVQADGTWSFDHTPPAGSSTLRLQFAQTIGDEARVSQSFVLETGEGVPAPNDPTELAVPTVTSGAVQAGTTSRLAGTATPGAHIRILDTSGRQIVPGDLLVGDDGTWSAEVAVPSTDSTFVFRVEQFLGDLHGVSDPISVDVEGVTPPDGAAFVAPTVQNTTFTAGAPNHFTGTATPGATLHVEFLNGWQSHEEEIQVGADGTWSFDHTVPADLYSLHLRFVQTVAGEDTTSKVFSLTRSYS